MKNKSPIYNYSYIGIIFCRHAHADVDMANRCRYYNKSLPDIRTITLRVLPFLWDEFDLLI